MLEEVIKTYQVYKQCRNGAVLIDSDGDDICELGRRGNWIGFEVRAFCIMANE